MDEFKLKIKEKKLQEINLEKSNLNTFVKNFNITQAQKKNKLTELNNKYTNTMELQNKLKNIDGEKFNEEINSIKEEIVKENKNLETNKLLFEDLKKKILIEKNNICEKEKIFLENKKKSDLTIKKKNEDIEKFENKMNNTKIVKENLKNKIDSIVLKIKNIKKTANQNSLNNVLERHSLLQENLNNLMLKKNIIKENKILKRKLYDEEIIFRNLIDVRKEEKEMIKKQYLDSINENNIVDMMNQIDDKLKEFDKETKRLIFFSQEKITNLKNKINRGNEIYTINQSRKVMEKQRLNKIYSSEIDALIHQKKVLNIQLENYNEDYKFLNTTIENIKNELQIIIINIEIMDSKFNEDIKKDRNKNVSELKEKEKLFEIKNDETKEKIVHLKKLIEEIKDNFYKEQKELQNQKNKLKVNSNNLLKDISELKNDIEIEEENFNSQKKKYELRIKYLVDRLQKENHLN